LKTADSNEEEDKATGKRSTFGLSELNSRLMHINQISPKFQPYIGATAHCSEINWHLPPKKLKSVQCIYNQFLLKNDDVTAAYKLIANNKIKRSKSQ